jgi:hypothetical protein
MRVGGGALFGIGVEGRAGGVGGWEGRGEDSGSGCLSPAAPPPAATGIGNGGGIHCTLFLCSIVVCALSLAVGGVGKGGRRWWWVRLQGRCWSNGDVFLLLLVVFVVAV